MAARQMALLCMAWPSTKDRSCRRVVRGRGRWSRTRRCQVDTAARAILAAVMLWLHAGVLRGANS